LSRKTERTPDNGGVLDRKPSNERLLNLERNPSIEKLDLLILERKPSNDKLALERKTSNDKVDRKPSNEKVNK